MRDVRETIEYRVECDGWISEDQRCPNATPFFSDREFPHPADPEVDAEDMANKWAKEHGWKWTRVYGHTGDILDYCPECWAKRQKEEQEQENGE